jgi:putative membrane protein
MTGARPTTGSRALLAILALYASVRIVEVLTGTPRTSIVTLDVLSALVFALMDGARHFGWRGILVFGAICAIIGTAVENLGLATGFPFGHYEFLALMGPRLFHVPVLIGVAYFGMAYVSWMLARLILGSATTRVVAQPLLAGCIMLAWDWAQDPVWATLLHAWRWRDGGPWFGVPLSNYFGWYLTVLLIYVVFSFYLRRWPPSAARLDPPASWPPVAFYALCAAGNALQVFTRIPQQTVIDASGKSWRVADILAASALVSIFVMGSFVVAATRRLGAQVWPQLSS